MCNCRCRLQSPQRGNPVAVQGSALRNLVRVSGALKGRPNLLCGFPEGMFYEGAYAGSCGTQLLGFAPSTRLSSSHVRCAMLPVGLCRATVWSGVVTCCARTPYNLRPTARSRSIPHVPLVVRDLVPFEKCTVLVLERFRSVVFALVRDVLAYGGHVGLRHGEGAIACLP